MASIRKQGSKWQAIIRRKGHKTLSKTFTKKVLAEAWSRKTEEELARKRYINSVASETTVGDLLDRYETEISPRKKSAKIESYRIATLNEYLGVITLEELTSKVILDFVDERLEDVSSDSVRKELNILSAVVNAGMALWKVELPANPVSTAREVLKVTQTLSQGVKRTRRPSQDELEALYRKLPDEMALLVEFAIETGMRRGEIVNMKTDHRSDSLLHIPETKTDTPRTIPLSKRAKEILDQVGTFKYVESSISHMFKRACRKCDIEDLRFHDLRHEAASRFFERGLRIEEVSLITGQSWAVLKRYTHLKPESLVEKLQ